MAKWKSKEIVVDAFQLGIDDLPRWYIEMVGDHKAVYYTDNKDRAASHVYTPEGHMVASYGNYIVKDTYGGVRVMSEEYFTRMFERMDSENGKTEALG